MQTNIDHIKVIASNRFPDTIENMNDEDQNAYIEYIKDIIQKITEKGRKFKVTIKKKYIIDGLMSPASQRISSVYVLIIANSNLFFTNTSSFES